MSASGARLPYPAIDAASGEQRWAEPVPRSMLFVETAARGSGPHGSAPYETAVENAGQALIFDFADGAPTARRDGRASPWIGKQTFTGGGVYLTVESGQRQINKATAGGPPTNRACRRIFLRGSSFRQPDRSSISTLRRTPSRCCTTVRRAGRRSVL